MSTRGAELISQITNANHPAEEAVNENAEENNALDITAQSNASKKQLVNHHLLAANDLIGFCGGVHNGVALDADQMAKNLANAQRSGKSIVARVQSGGGRPRGNSARKNPNKAVAQSNPSNSARTNPNEAIVAQSNASKKPRVDYCLLAANNLIDFCGGVHNGVALDADQMAKNLANAQRSGKSIVARVGVRNSSTTVKTVFELHYEDELVLRTSYGPNELHPDVIAGDVYKRLVEDMTLQNDSQTMGQLLSIDNLGKEGLRGRLRYHVGGNDSLRAGNSRAGEPFHKLTVSKANGRFGPGDLGWHHARAEWEASVRNEQLIEQQQAHWSGLSGNPASIDDKVDLMEQLDAKVVGQMLGDNSKKSDQEKTRLVEVFNIIKSAVRTLSSSENVSTDDSIATMANAMADARADLGWMDMASTVATMEDVCMNAIINALANDDSVHQSNFTHLADSISDLPPELVVGSNGKERKKNTRVGISVKSGSNGKAYFYAVPTSSCGLLNVEIKATALVLDKVGPFIDDDYEAKSTNAKKKTLMDICKYVYIP